MSGSLEIFSGLRPPYEFIMADPPWSFKTRSAKGDEKSAKKHYDVMSLDEICALPVRDLAAKNCLLWLWATNPMLPQALDVMKAWGFTFKTSGHWVKRNPENGKLAFGTGYILRGSGEPFLIGAIGNPKTGRSIRSVIEGPRREHSRKPEAAYLAAAALMPCAHRLDLFSRQKRLGWDAWGHQTEWFQPLPETTDV